MFHVKHSAEAGSAFHVKRETIPKRRCLDASIRLVSSRSPFAIPHSKVDC